VRDRAAVSNQALRAKRAVAGARRAQLLVMANSKNHESIIHRFRNVISSARLHLRLLDPSRRHRPDSLPKQKPVRLVV